MSDTAPSVRSPEHQEVATTLRQVDERQYILRSGEGPWTVISDDWHERGRRNGGRFVAFSDPAHRSEALGRAAWDLTKGDGAPGFSQHYENGEWVTTYERNSAGPCIEPLVIVQQFHGVVPSRYLINQEFSLLMRLWEEPVTGNFYTILDDGSKELAIKVEGKKISIRTPLLRRYQAARQLDLLLFTDSVQYVDTDFDADEFAYMREEDHVENGDSVIFFGIGDGMITHRSVLSRLLGKRVLPPPPQEDSGVWPWEREDNHYPEFIIREDQNGREVRYTCNHERLANYFGANPEAPHYLTPVFFRREVLQRYYDDPGLYQVEDGRLTCAAMWSVQIDNGNPDVVMVFLGDIGRDIPSSHRDHWRAHNIAPLQGMSVTTFRRSFLAQFADSQNPEHVFKNAYLSAQTAWLETWGWPLYRETTGLDAQLIDRIRIPLNDTNAEFESQMLALAKLLVDLINEKDVAAGLPRVDGEKGIDKFRRFLTSVGYAEVDRDVALLRQIQTIRSRISAHTSGSSGPSFLASQLDGLSKPEFVKELMRRATQMLGDLEVLEAPA